MNRQIQITIPYGCNLAQAICQQETSLQPEQISDVRIIKRSIDARQRHKAIREILTLEYALDGEKLHRPTLEDTPTCQQIQRLQTQKPATDPIIIVGAGPAGLLCAYTLSRAGIPVEVIEQGNAVEQRQRDVQTFWQGGELKPQSNVQFGEGGAGTFSDGKLTTRIKSPHRDFILQLLVQSGAPENILWDAKPHVGTDILQKVLQRLRRELVDQGVIFKFGSHFQGLCWHAEAHQAIIDGIARPFNRLVLAVGNSARSTFQQLRKPLQLESKPLAIGVRIEHPRNLIDKRQYGKWHQQMPAAEYQLRTSCAQRGVYSFCMCPGGIVVNASSEPEHVCVNGMSYHNRQSPYSNSAIVVTVDQKDFASSAPLAGMEYQRHIEAACFRASGSYAPPAMGAMDFIQQRHATSYATSTAPHAHFCNIAPLLPAPVVQALRLALPVFQQKIPGFIEEGVLIAPETRTSSPVRFPRDPVARHSTVSHRIFPCGEGAGYAGGIVSAAVDGVNTAMAILTQTP
ncbi:NAD(P)/FAD-dependent oxidoreductase [Desulfurispira natronophila]|uniref:FAD-dependent protein C-terminal domain-containing protein n=1 Tax=Desulfurispira natronophila TaxID=682562 RepID=A0A7W7Y258_9BACT|nr:NAD(P)-binding protein [Desulfurispira natronophila]MBB5020710.1 hypothetical protein [Desulfurispira natronophila]